MPTRSTRTASSTYRLDLGQRRKGRIADTIFNVRAFQAGEYVYSRVVHGGKFKTAVEDACARYGLGRTTILERYSRTKRAGGPAKPLSFFCGTASDAERDAYEAEYEAWVEKVEAEIRAAETEGQRAAREADEAEQREVEERAFREWVQERQAKLARSGGPLK